MSADDFLQENKPAWDLDKLKPIHNDILRLWFSGWNRKDIAAEYGISRRMVYSVCESELGKKKLEQWEREQNKRMHDTKMKLIEHAHDAADALVELVKPDERHKISPTDRRLAASEILDRVGIGAASESKNLHVHLSGEDSLEDLKERATQDFGAFDEEEERKNGETEVHSLEEEN